MPTGERVLPVWMGMGGLDVWLWPVDGGWSATTKRHSWHSLLIGAVASYSRASKGENSLLCVE